MKLPFRGRFVQSRFLQTPGFTGKPFYPVTVNGFLKITAAYPHPKLNRVAGLKGFALRHVKARGAEQVADPERKQVDAFAGFEQLFGKLAAF